MNYNSTFLPSVRALTRREFVSCLPLPLLVARQVGDLVRMGAALKHIAGPSKSGGERSKPLIYVVVDFEDVLELYRVAFQQGGWAVKAFSDRAKALTSFLETHRRPDVLLTDFEGYPFSAEHLMHRCRHAQPGLKILMASGYDESCLAGCQVKPDRFLALPVTMDQLLVEATALLDGKAPQNN